MGGRALGHWLRDWLRGRGGHDRAGRRSDRRRRRCFSHGCSGGRSFCGGFQNRPDLRYALFKGSGVRRGCLRQSGCFRRSQRDDFPRGLEFGGDSLRDGGFYNGGLHNGGCRNGRLRGDNFRLRVEDERRDRSRIRHDVGGGDRLVAQGQALGHRRSGFLILRQHGIERRQNPVAEAVTAKIEAAMEVIALASPETAALPETPAPDAASLEEGVAEIGGDMEATAETPATAAAVAATPPPAPVTPAPRSIMIASASQPVPQPMAERTPAHDEPVSQAPVVTTATSLPDLAQAADPAPESATALADEDTASSNDLWADIEAEIAPLPPFDPAHEDSLGASLIEQGVVARPSNDRADLLAPIRRMRHAERIAFFS